MRHRIFKNGETVKLTGDVTFLLGDTATILGYDGLGKRYFCEGGNLNKGWVDAVWIDEEPTENGYRISIEENKELITFDDYFESLKYLWKKVENYQRLELPICKGCGSLDTSCRCWDDE